MKYCDLVLWQAPRYRYEELSEWLQALEESCRVGTGNTDGNPFSLKMRYLIEGMFEVWETRQDTLDIPIYNI